MRRGLNIFLLVLKILIPVALLVFLVLSGTDLAKAHLEDLAHANDEGFYAQKYGLTFFGLLILSFIYNGVVLVLSLVGLFTSIGYRSAYSRKRNIVTFVILTIAPFVTELLLVVMYNVIPGIVG